MEKQGLGIQSSELLTLWRPLAKTHRASFADSHSCRQQQGICLAAQSAEVCLRIFCPRTKKIGRPASQGWSQGGPGGRSGIDGTGRSEVRGPESLARRSGACHNLPAYVIFHDATLGTVAAVAPQSLSDLQGISGIGAAKLEKYGSGVLWVVATWFAGAIRGRRGGEGARRRTRSHRGRSRETRDSRRPLRR